MNDKKIKNENVASNKLNKEDINNINNKLLPIVNKLLIRVEKINEIKKEINDNIITINKLNKNINSKKNILEKLSSIYEKNINKKEEDFIDNENKKEILNEYIKISEKKKNRILNEEYYDLMIKQKQLEMDEYLLKLVKKEKLNDTNSKILKNHIPKPKNSSYSSFSYDLKRKSNKSSFFYSNSCSDLRYFKINNEKINFREGDKNKENYSDDRIVKKNHKNN